MSDFDLSKNKQNYEEKPIFPVCKNCQHILIDYRPKYYGDRKPHEENVRCGIGGFPVKKYANCNQHSLKNTN